MLPSAPNSSASQNQTSGMHCTHGDVAVVVWLAGPAIWTQVLFGKRLTAHFIRSSKMVPSKALLSLAVWVCVWRCDGVSVVSLFHVWHVCCHHDNLESPSKCWQVFHFNRASSLGLETALFILKQLCVAGGVTSETHQAAEMTRVPQTEEYYSSLKLN